MISDKMFEYVYICYLIKVIRALLESRILGGATSRNMRWFNFGLFHLITVNIFAGLVPDKYFPAC